MQQLASYLRRGHCYQKRGSLLRRRSGQNLWTLEGGDSADGSGSKIKIFRQIYTNSRGKAVTYHM